MRKRIRMKAVGRKEPRGLAVRLRKAMVLTPVPTLPALQEHLGTAHVKSFLVWREGSYLETSKQQMQTLLQNTKAQGAVLAPLAILAMTERS